MEETLEQVIDFLHRRHVDVTPPWVITPADRSYVNKTRYLDYLKEDWASMRTGEVYNPGQIPEKTVLVALTGSFWGPKRYLKRDSVLNTQHIQAKWCGYVQKESDYTGHHSVKLYHHKFVVNGFEFTEPGAYWMIFSTPTRIGMYPYDDERYLEVSLEHLQPVVFLLDQYGSVACGMIDAYHADFYSRGGFVDATSTQGRLPQITISGEVPKFLQKYIVNL